MLYSSTVCHLHLQERQRQAVDRSGLDRQDTLFVYRESCAPSLALIPKRLELPVSRGAGGRPLFWSCRDTRRATTASRLERAMGSAACKRHEDGLYQWLEALEDRRVA
jgi:hypothetical protein